MSTSLQQASSALQRGNLGRAGTLLEQLRLTDASNPKIWLLSASYYHQAGDHAGAMDALKTASAMALNDRTTRLQVVQAYMNLQAWELAMHLLQEMDPQQRQLPLEHARCLWGVGKYQLSLQRWQQYAQALPEVAEVQFRLWQCLERLGLTSAADQQRQRCNGWLGKHIGISMIELLYLVSEQRYEDCWSLLQSCFAEHGKDALPFTNAAVCLAHWPPAVDCRPDALTVSALLDSLDHRGKALLSSQRWLLQNNLQQMYANSTHLLQAAPALLPQSLAATGLVLEFGVFHGRSIRIIADRLKQTGHDTVVHGFDSFAGLPEDWNTEPAGSYSTHGRLPEVPDNVRLHQGWFDESLDAFLADHDAPVALVHIDCDLYSSTRDVLLRLRDQLRPGSVIVFDELLGYPGYEQHEMRAFQELMRDWPGSFQLLGASFMDRAVVVQLSE